MRVCRGITSLFLSPASVQRLAPGRTKKAPPELTPAMPTNDGWRVNERRLQGWQPVQSAARHEGAEKLPARNGEESKESCLAPALLTWLELARQSLSFGNLLRRHNMFNLG